MIAAKGRGKMMQMCQNMCIDQGKGKPMMAITDVDNNDTGNNDMGCSWGSSGKGGGSWGVKKEKMPWDSDSEDEFVKQPVAKKPKVIADLGGLWKPANEVKQDAGAGVVGPSRKPVVSTGDPERMTSLRESSISSVLTTPRKKHGGHIAENSRATIVILQGMATTPSRGSALIT